MPEEGTHPIFLPSGVHYDVIIWDRMLRTLRSSYRLSQEEAYDLRSIWLTVSTGDTVRVRDWRGWNTTKNMVNPTITALDQPLQNTADNSFLGDGSTTVFQAVINYTAGSIQNTRVITKLRDPPVPKVAVNEIEVFTPGDFTYDADTGLFTFSVAPPNTQTVKAGFYHDIAVRIVGNQAWEEALIAGDLVDISDLELQEVNI
jgi:uncharacterized protein (TIGR02217 family)